MAKFTNSSLITKDVRKYAAELGITEEDTLKKGMGGESTEFSKNDSKLYAKV